MDLVHRSYQDRTVPLGATGPYLLSSYPLDLLTVLLKDTF